MPMEQSLLITVELDICNLTTSKPRPKTLENVRAFARAFRPA